MNELNAVGMVSEKELVEEELRLLGVELEGFGSEELPPPHADKNPLIKMTNANV